MQRASPFITHDAGTASTEQADLPQYLSFREVWYDNAMTKLEKHSAAAAHQTLPHEWLNEMRAAQHHQCEFAGTDEDREECAIEVQREWMQRYNYAFQRGVRRDNAYFERNFVDPFQHERDHERDGGDTASRYLQNESTDSSTYDSGATNNNDVNATDNPDHRASQHLSQNSIRQPHQSAAPNAARDAGENGAADDRLRENTGADKNSISQRLRLGPFGLGPGPQADVPNSSSAGPAGIYQFKPAQGNGHPAQAWNQEQGLPYRATQNSYNVHSPAFQH